MGFLAYLSPQIRILCQFIFDPANQGYRDVAQEQQWPLRHKIGIIIFEKNICKGLNFCNSTVLT